MAENPNKLARFWHELNRRGVLRVIATYAATSYIIIQVVNNLVGPLNMAPWVATMAIITLAFGFPVVIILSWVFDLTPQGIKKTESVKSAGRKGPTVKASRRRLKTSDIVIAVLLVVVVILAYPKIFNQDSLENLKDKDGKISVAIMPFLNMTNDTTLDYWQDGIQTSLATSLSDAKEITIRFESLKGLLKVKEITNYASITPSMAGDFSRRLKASIFISGSIIKGGNRLRLTAQVSDSKSEKILKPFEVDGPYNGSVSINMIDSLRKLVKNYILISLLKKELPPYARDYDVLTSSPEAYRLSILGNQASGKFYYDKAIAYYKAALEIDSNYIYPMTGLSTVYWNQALGSPSKALYDEGKKLCLKVYSQRDKLSYYEKLWADVNYAMFFQSEYEAIKYLLVLKDLDKMNPDITYNLGASYWFLKEYEKSISEFKQTLEIYKEWGVKPDWVNPYTVLGENYIETGQYKELRNIIRKMERDFPKDPDASGLRAILCLKLGDTVAGARNIEKHISVKKEYFPGRVFSEAELMDLRASIYVRADNFRKAEEYIRKTLLLEPDKTGRMYSLAYLLIDNDLNVNEGLEMIEKLLKLRPDSYSLLEGKGWGLYKQGKYKEALDILQKSWDSRLKNGIYKHTAYLHLEAANKAAAGMK
jgi:tetratricopeptide (TPR) repeat protein